MAARQRDRDQTGRSARSGGQTGGRLPTGAVVHRVPGSKARGHRASAEDATADVEKIHEGTATVAHPHGFLPRGHVESPRRMLAGRSA